jgi:nucleoid DNA-binding protein
MAKANSTSGATKPMTKSALIGALAERTGLNRKQVLQVFDELQNVIKEQLGKKGPGVINVMRLVKVYKKQMPARKAGTRPNPFKPGEMIEVKARPAYNVVKVRPLSDLKAMV